MQDWLNERAVENPDRKILRDGEEIYTYQRLSQESWNTADGLEKEGVKKGDPVALLGLNSIFHLLAAFGCWRLGATLVPLNYRLSDRELSTIIEDCKPALVLFDEDNRGRVDGKAFSEIEGQEDHSSSVVSLNPEDPALILYTSGTTGKAKGAILSHRMVMANLQNTTRGWGLTGEDRTLLFAPLFHTGGWNVLTLPLLHCGGHSTLMEKFEVFQIIDYIRQGEVTALFGVPTMFQMILHHWDLTEEEATPIRFFISGGAPCPVELIESYLDLGINFRQGYGMTEVGPNCFYFPPDLVREKRGKVGMPMEGTRMKVLGEEEVGELAISGDHLFSGYWNNSEETQKTLQDGWVHTGDLVKRDQDGFFSIVGRKKEMFISGGENVYPAEVVQVLEKHPEIREAAVMALPHEKWGEVGVAFIALEEGSPSGPSEIKEYLRENLAHYKVPREYHFLQELPRNTMGKVIQAELRKILKG